MSNTTLRTSPRPLALLIPFLLSACGGGGGGGSASDAPATVAAPPAQTSTPTAPSQAAKVGIIDSGISPGRSGFNYQNIIFTSYLDGSTTPNDNMGINGHGTVVALTLAGLATADFAGGVSPDSTLYIAQASQNNQFDYSVTARAINGLLGDGVRIFSMSYGSTERLTTAQALSDAQQSGRYHSLYQGLRAIADANGLAVVITGNNGTATPSPDAQMPLIYQDPLLAQHMLAVTGTVTSGAYNQPNRPAALGPFDACGNAAAWCLSAPGYVDYPYQNSDGSWSDVRSYGTSFAVPRVAGSASQVLQRFPWMDGNNLQQTLLTTATYRSDAFGTSADTANGRPYNDTFGWGDVNLTKALQGPALFYAQDFHARLDGGSYVFANDIGGDYGLVLDGSQNNGVLTLTGNNSYRGLTSVSANTLLINGAVTGDARVSGSGTLGGSGRIGGSLLNQGTVNGGLQVAGNYQQDASAALNITLDSPLRVTGSSTLAGSLNLAPPSSTYIVKQQETLLTSGAGISGTFNQVNTGAFLTGSVSYSANSVTGLLTRRNTSEAASAMGLSSLSTQQTADNLEQAFSAADSLQGQSTLSRDQQTALGEAAAFETLPDADRAQSAINSVSGQAHASNNALLFNALDYQTRLLNNRLTEASQEDRYGFWLESGRLRGAMAQDGYLGNRYHNTLTALGVDSSLGLDGLRAGIAWTQNQIDSDYAESGGSSQNRLQGVMLYGRYALSPEWYLQGNLSYQYGHNDVKRQVVIDQPTAVSSSTRSDSWQAALQSGYRWSLAEDYRIEPYLGWRETGLQTGPFNDQGSAFGLQGGGDSYQRSVGYGGLNLSARQAWLAGWWSMLSLYAEYQYALNNPSMDVSARWSGFGQQQSTFDIPGMQLDRRSQWYGARVDVARIANMRLFMRADQHQASRGNEQVLRGGVDMSF